MKRLFKAVISLLLILAMLPVPAMADEALTEEAVYRKIIALKEEYPEGTPWTNDNFYAWNGGIYSGGYGCAGFAFMLSDAAFGNLPARQMETGISLDTVRVGDILRINEDTHSVILLEVNEDHVVIAEGNYNSSVHWGRTLTGAEVAAATYLLTRYPEEQAHVHTMTKTEAKAPTCTEGGTNGYYTCSGCDKVFRDEAGTTETTVGAEALAPLGHTYEEAWRSDDTGHWRKCANCEAVTDRENHAFSWVTDQAATEEATGIKHEECVCGLKRNENTVIEKLEHIHRDIQHHAAVEATCLTDGTKEYWTCGSCGGHFSDEACTTQITEDALTVAALGHNLTKHESSSATCTEPGNMTYWNCSRCGKYYADADAQIETTAEKVLTDPAGHDFGEGVVTREPTEDKTGVRTYTCSACGEKKTEEIPALGNADVIRIAGENRVETAFQAADTLLQMQGDGSFDTIILASGNDFADALAGSYLASVKKAPILLFRKNYEDEILDYIRNNLSTGGTVYILGGTAAVTQEMEDALEEFHVIRLQGDNRYLTNLEILEEAGIQGDTILVTTGLAFADSLAASATGLPILMVNSKKDALTDEQAAFLRENTGKKLVILGGTTVVSEKLEAELATYGEVDRVWGERREETAVAIARRFFSDVETAVVAYSREFPDGLCGGPLAQALGCPLLLVSENTVSYPADYLAAQGVTAGYVMGGTAVISQDVANQVFGG